MTGRIRKENQLTIGHVTAYVHFTHGIYMCKSFETRLYIHSVGGDYWLLTHDR